MKSLKSWKWLFKKRNALSDGVWLSSCLCFL